MAVGPDGSVYVTDKINCRVQRFTGTGTYLGEWGVLGSSSGEFLFPEGISTGPDGTVYVADFDNYRIQKFNATGTYTGGWGSLGSEVGEFNGPVNIAVGPTGKVHVTDYTNDRVQVFAASGSFLFEWGSSGTGNGQLTKPFGIAIQEELQTGIGDEPGTVPGYRVLPAFPNPFRQSTQVRFVIPEPGPTRARVYDVRGRLVRDLEDSYRQAGEHSMIWDGRIDRGLLEPPGVYFLNLESGSFRDTRRLTLIR